MARERTSRDFVPWRFSDAGYRSAWLDRRCRRPKTCTVPAAADDLVTDRFAAAARTVDFVDLLFRFVILGSPEKPKGPGEGALRQVWLHVIGGSDRIVSEQR